MSVKKVRAGTVMSERQSVANKQPSKKECEKERREINNKKAR